MAFEDIALPPMTTQPAGGAGSDAIATGQRRSRWWRALDRWSGSAGGVPRLTSQGESRGLPRAWPTSALFRSE